MTLMICASRPQKIPKNLSKSRSKIYHGVGTTLHTTLMCCFVNVQEKNEEWGSPCYVAEKSRDCKICPI